MIEMDVSKKMRQFGPWLALGVLALAIISAGVSFMLRQHSRDMAELLQQRIVVGDGEAGVMDQFGRPDSTLTTGVERRVWTYRFFFNSVRVEFQRGRVKSVRTIGG